MDQAYEQQAAGRSPDSAPRDDSTTSYRRGLWKAIAIFIGQRLLFGAFVLLAIIYITYFAFSIAQGAEVSTALGQAASLTVAYVVNFLQGDLGLSQPGSAAFQAQPIMEILPEVGLSRQGWEKTAHLPNDTVTFVSSQNLEDAGRALSLGLMIIGRDEGY